MKHMAFVSSFSDTCGNAYFTKILMESVAKLGIKTSCEGLELTITQSIDSYQRKLADKHIAERAQRLKDYDSVNIQLEGGLYGTIPSDIKKRIKTLVSANKNTSVTLHSPRIIKKSSADRHIIKQLLLLKFKNAKEAFVEQRKKNIHINMNIAIIKWLVRKNIKLIVHTTRAKEQIARLFNYHNVTIHPLQIVPEDFKPDRKKFGEVKNYTNLAEKDIVIGMFGFISEYKGHTAALEAMRYLPKNFKLMIFGRQHPQSIIDSELCSPYLERLQEKIKKNRILRNRVFFMGEYDTPSFMNFASCVDAIWLPYAENGQDGSGIASICFDASERVICSHSFAFDELFKLIEYNNYYRCDIGNSIELAQKTQMALRDTNLTIERDRTKFNLGTQASLYAS